MPTAPFASSDLPAAPASANAAEDVLRLVEATNVATGHDFFRSLARHLAGALGVRYALVGELHGTDAPGDPRRIRILALWGGTAYLENTEYDLAGTPCENVIAGRICDYPRDVARLFPRDEALVTMGAQSYLGVPLYDTSDEALGLLSVLHDRPTDGDAGGYRPGVNARGILRIFAGRAAAELQRLRRDEQLRATIASLHEAQERLTASEKKYAALVETNPGGVWQVTLDGRTVYMNPAMRRMLELPEGQESPGDVTYHRFFTPESFARIRVEHAKRLHGQSSTYDVEMIGLKGGRRAVTIAGAPVVGADGTVLGLIGTFTDITEDRQNEQRLRLLVDQVPAVLWTISADGHFTSGMGAGLAKLNLGSERFENVTMADVFQPEDFADGKVPPAVEAQRRALAGEPTHYEQAWRGRSYACHVEPLRSVDGVVTGAVGVALDITDRKQAEDELRRAHDELEARVRERTAELSDANAKLLREIEDRKRAESNLLRSQEQLRHSTEIAQEAADHNRRLARELDHRVRNNLMGLLSLVAAMRQRTRDVDSFASAIEGRLLAMHHVYQVLSGANYEPVDLGAVVSSLLAAAGNLGCEPVQLKVDGPKVSLNPQQTLAVSVILMEWFINSCKYGAHAHAGSAVNVTWDLGPSSPTAAPEDGKQLVLLRWRESDGPPVASAGTPSLGTELVNAFASRELRGRCELRYPPTGADHLLEFPIAT